MIPLSKHSRLFSWINIFNEWKGVPFRRAGVAFAAGALMTATVAPRSHAQTVNLAVESAVAEIVGTTAVIPPGSSGTRANTATWNFDSRARFNLSGTGTNGVPLAAGLEVRPSAATGALKINTDSLMIARSTNSQGLLDPGSLAVYVNPVERGPWSLELEFRMYEEGFLKPLTAAVQVAALDLDSGQKLAFTEADFSGFTLEANTRLSFSRNAAGETLFQGNGNGDISDPRHSFIATSRLKDTFRIRLEHGSVALFAFEFRSPARNVTYANPVTYPFDTVPYAPELFILETRQITWLSDAAFVYQVQASQDLRAWTNSGAPQRGNGGILSFTPPPGTRGFYRVRVSAL